MRDIPTDIEAYEIWISDLNTQSYSQFYGNTECNSHVYNLFLTYINQYQIDLDIFQFVEEITLFNFQFIPWIYAQPEYQIYCLNYQPGEGGQGNGQDGEQIEQNLNYECTSLSDYIGWLFGSGLDCSDEVQNYIIENDLIDITSGSINIGSINCYDIVSTYINGFLSPQYEFIAQSIGATQNDIIQFNNELIYYASQQSCTVEGILEGLCTWANIVFTTVTTGIPPTPKRIAYAEKICNFINPPTPPIICQDGTQVQNIEECPENKNYVKLILIALGLYAFST